MGVGISVESNIADMADFLAELSRNAPAAESAKALNRTTTFIRGAVVDDVHARTGIAKPLLRRRIKPIRNHRASAKRLRAAGFVGEVSMPVGKLKPKPRRQGRGVVYKTIPGSPKVDNAFYAVMPGGGKKSAFYRKPNAAWDPVKKATLPIAEVRVNIGLFLRRATRRILRQPAAEFYHRLFLQNMEQRADKELAKRGLKRA